ncbi:hypothetical protein LOTGIDRAFT_63855, partial [Lottia gigantea]
SNSNHGDMILAGLQILYESGELTDVTLQSPDSQLCCHRNVLAACSPYFRAMFTMKLRETVEQTVELHDIGPGILPNIVRFIYTGQVSINHSNIQSLLIAANMLQLDSLSKLCIDYASSKLDIENCVDVYNLADFVNLSDLKALSKKFIYENFDKISETNALCNASSNFMIEMLSSNDIITEKEETVYNLLEKWIVCDHDKRSTFFPLLFQYVRLPLLDGSFISKTLACSELVTSNERCCELLNLATHAKGDGNSNQNAELRKGMCNRPLLIFSGGSISERSRSFTCFDTETHKSYIGVEQHPTFDAKFKIEHFQLIVGTDNSILFLGGAWKEALQFEGIEALNDVLKYSQRDRKWIYCAPMTHGRCSFACCAYEDRIYVFGGKDRRHNGHVLDQSEFYAVESDHWQTIQSMPVGISHQAVTVWKNYIYTFGGIDDENAYLNTVLVYSVFRDTWSLVPTELSRPRADCQAFTFKDTIFVLGGADKHENQTNIDVYDPEKNRWSEGQIFPDDRKIMAITKYKDAIYVC